MELATVQVSKTCELLFNTTVQMGMPVCCHVALTTRPHTSHFPKKISRVIGLLEYINFVLKCK